MGLWSRIKNAAKKVWRAVKAVVRVVVRVVIMIVNRLTFGLPDLLLGFLAWPPKRMRLHVFILSAEAPPFSPTPGFGPVASSQDVLNAVDRAKRIYKEKFNVNVRPYAETFVQVLTDTAPPEALDFECGIGSEFGEAGEYFAKHLAGWNAIPISLTFPITVFVVRSFKGTDLGCSMSVIGDYVVIAQPGLMDNVALAHEIGHTCGLWHSGTTDNLMFRSPPAGENVKWFQKNILRSSRHVQYW
jgi:hypothetical protein